MTPAAESVDTVVLGAGAAGLMCAFQAGQRGRRVLLLDHADRAGKKILISGGGRANFTNLGCTADNFLSENPHFARSALARFTPTDMVALVEKHDIPYHEKTLGQLFCDRSARDVVDLLEQECAEAGVCTLLETTIAAVHARAGGGFAIEIRREGRATVVHTQTLVVATGGLSIPKIGATGFGYELARQFLLGVIPCRPGLVPLTFAEPDRARWCDLAGLSTTCTASVEQSPQQRRAAFAPRFREKLLITHRGLSGPAGLQISSFWGSGVQLAFDLAPGDTVFAPLLEAGARRDPLAALAALRTHLPARLAERWLEQTLPESDDRPRRRDLTNVAIAELESKLHAWTVSPSGTEGYAKAEVTAGGIDTGELDARTLEARTVPGLFFIGEVIDVTGWLGGYNFQWAWASGFAAGQAC